MLDYEYVELGYDSGSSATYYFRAFYLHVDKSVGSVSVLGSEMFAPTGVDSKCDILHLTFSHQQELIPKVVNSLKCFGAQITYSRSKFENQFYSYSRS